MALLRFLLQRLLAALPVLMLVSIVSFGLIFLLPGDPAEAILGQNASPADVQQLRHRLGLDRPLPVQFGEWLGSVVHGDLGRSLRDNRPVAGLLSQRLSISGQLSLFALTLAIIPGIPAGVLAAVRRNSIWDWLATALSIVTTSAPVFLLGLLLIYLFSLHLRWLPPGGFVPLSNGFLPYLTAMLLPALTHAGPTLALVVRMTRSAMLDVLHEDYVRTARAKGLTAARVFFRHGLRNALLPVVTTVGLQIGYMLGSSVIAETVFTLPGLGRLLMDSLATRDYPVVQAVVLLFAVIFVAVNVVVDVTYALLDPRVAYA